MTLAINETAAQNSLPDKIRFAQAMADASLLPKEYRQQPANVLVAMELGDALGIAPIVAINEVNVINGSPSLSASLMAALARQAGHKVRVTGDAKSATCTIVRADDPDFTHEATWDEAKAKQAGLWGKGHWAKDAGTMLRWRAISECVRFACSEVLGGIKYTPEELRDSQPVVAVTQIHDTPEPAAKPPSLATAVQSHKAIHAAEPVDDPEPDYRTDAQSRKMFATARDAGVSNDELKPFMASVLGREVESSKTLTKAECARVIEALEMAKADPESGEMPIEAELVDDEGGWPTVATAGAR